MAIEPRRPEMSWTHLRDETPKARKGYSCCLCGDPIRVGDQHVKRVGINEDGMEVSRMHTRCEAATENWDMTDWECFDGPSVEFRESLERENTQGEIHDIS
jgi:hypothetical protein